MPFFGSLGILITRLLVVAAVVVIISEFSTLAGAGISGYFNGTSTIQFNAPNGVAVDSSGNVYVADKTNHRIRKISPVGVVSTLAGSGSSASVDGTGVGASFQSPISVALDSTGVVYVGEEGQRIRKITPEGVVTTFAGSTVGFEDGSGMNAKFYSPRGLLVDSSGTVYVADFYNNRIRKITPAGVVTTFAGSGSRAFADGTGTNASFGYPWGIAMDSFGNLYIGDYFNNLIRKITPDAVVSTFAGSGSPEPLAADGTGTNATFWGPAGVAVDSVGNVYVADNQNHRIRKISPVGVVSTIAGSGTAAFAEGTGTNASFQYPTGVAFDSTGTLYVPDEANHRIRKISPVGLVTTMAGSGNPGFTNSVQTGAVSGALLNLPRAVAVDSSSTMYVADTTNHRIRKITSAGVVTTLAGSGTATFADGTGTSASFNSPQGITVDSAGNVYVGDTLNNRVRKITPSGVVSTLAGSGTATFADGTGTGASFNNPYGITVDSAGIVYVVDKLNYRVRKMTINILVATFAGGTYGSNDGTGTNAQFFNPAGVAVDSLGNVYVADPSANWIRKITPAGVVTVFAGNLNTGFTDGTGTNASFNQPNGVAVDSAGNVYVADTSQHLIRKITPLGVVSTLAGNRAGGPFGAFANGTGTNASFAVPSGIAVDSAGNVYVGDQFNDCIRKITPAGVVTTMAGRGAGIFSSPSGVAVDSTGNVYVTNVSQGQIIRITTADVVTVLAGGTTPGFADGTGTNARFNSPRGITVDSTGNIYVADVENNRIRRITPAGVVTTVVGQTTAGSTDGIGTNASFSKPYGIAFATDGTLYVSDNNTQRIRKITESGVVTTLAGNGTAQYLEGTGTNARFLNPFGIVVNSAGTLMYVTDSNYIRRITSAGVTTFIAGQATAGSTNATGVSASFSGPREIALLAAGTSVYVADTGNHIIRRVTTDFGVTTKYSGFGGAGFRETPVANVQYNNPSGIAVNSAGVVYVADTNNNRIRTIAAGSDNTGVVTTVVGTSTAGYSDGGGWFNSPFGVATDWDGTVYVADTINNYIRKITPAGVVTSLAGNGAATFADGTGTSASFNGPRGLAIGSDGTVYVADTTNSRIRRITPAGVVTTVAGSSDGNNNGTGTNARFTTPNAITVDSSDIMYVADTGTHRIRKITQANVVTTFSGSTQGFADGAGTSARFDTPRGIAADIYGNIYVADTNNHRIRRIVSDGTVTTFAGSTVGFADGIGTNAKFNFPTHLFINALGTLYVADQTNHCIRIIQPSTGVVSTLAGDGTAGFTLSRFNSPFGITVERFRNAYIADTNNHSIRKIANVYTVPENNAVVTTFAGSGTQASSDGTGTNASFRSPFGITLDSVGNIYVTEISTGGHNIRKITPAGVVTRFAGGGVSGNTDATGTNARFNVPYSLAVDSAGNVYVGDESNRRLRKITPAGVVTTVAGSTNGFADATGTNAQFSGLSGLAVDSAGNVYVCDRGNNRIRKVTPAGVVTTLAGNGAGIGYLDGTGTNARFSNPFGLAIDSAGVLYVGENQGYRIRKVTSTGVVTTLAGSGTATFADGTGTNASFNLINGVAIDSAGNVYVGDSGNNRIRKVTPAGVVTTLAGSGTATFADGTGTGASFNTPNGVAVDPAGNVYVADQTNNRIRKIGTTVPQQSLVMNAVQRYSIGTFNNPRGIAVDNSSGFIYVAAYNNNVVVRIPPNGGTSTFATLSFPLGVAVDSAGNVYVSAAGRIYKITPAGGVTTFAGDGTDGFADGTGTNARFSSANGLAFDSSGNLYVADQVNNRIRKITPAGVVTTLAGGFPVFNYPTGVAVDSLGNVYVADSETHRIKKVTPAGVVTLVAGINQGYQDGSALGLPNALFNLPTGVAVDSSGNLLVADNRNHRIRKITPDGVVTTFAGDGTQIRGYDSEIGTNASFNNPYAIALNSSGQMFITDGSTSTQGVVRKIS